MIQKITKNGKMNTLVLITFFSILISLSFTLVYAEPIGPDVTILGNTTKNTTAAAKVNSTINGSKSPGGYIFTISLNSEQQNTRWKAYVGNVTGTLTLDDASDNTIFQWTLTEVTGEVYATRTSESINWSGINCTWVADSKQDRAEGLTSNRTPEHNENEALSHSNKDDNITATFAYTNHSALQVGSVAIGKDECYSLQTWQAGQQNGQVFDDSDNANFTQVILYDGAFGNTDGNVVYVTEMENDITGYDSTETFDFQMILPENGAASWSSSTAYYFYVELT